MIEEMTEEIEGITTGGTMIEETTEETDVMIEEVEEIAEEEVVEEDKFKKPRVVRYGLLESN